MKESVQKILESTTAAAPKMTHSLTVYGGGNMGEGIRKLWAEGQNSGVCTGLVVGSIVWGSGIAIYQVIKNAPRKLKEIKVKGEAYHAGYVKGRDEKMFEEEEH